MLIAMTHGSPDFVLMRRSRLLHRRMDSTMNVASTAYCHVPVHSRMHAWLNNQPKPLMRLTASVGSITDTLTYNWDLLLH